MVTAPPALSLEALTTAIDSLIATDGGETVVGDLCIQVSCRSIHTVVLIEHTTLTATALMRNGVGDVPWAVEYHLNYDPTDHAGIAEWHGFILDSLARGPR